MLWFASRSHYAAHMEPVRQAHDSAGRRFSTRHVDWGEPAAAMPAGPVVVASAVDAQRFLDRDVIYLEHGSGQNYSGDPLAASNPSYSGGDGLDHVRLFICPNDAVAARWSARYPDAATAVVGCARLDQHYPPQPRVDGPARIGFVFHWECTLCPETRSAWKHWRDATLRFVVNTGGMQVAAHCHPRAPEIAASLRSLGVPYIDDVDDMLRWADVIVADNTSVLYEACAVGNQTVVLNAPWYRRNIEHGLRFWSHPPGPQIDNPGQLVETIIHAATDPGWAATIRYEASVAAYSGLVDGGAAVRAAEAINAVRLV